MTTARLAVDPAFWQGRRVLLTGHTGFKGSWAALWLSRLGAQVTGLALPPETTPSLFALTDAAADIGHSILDIRDADALVGAVRGARPDVVLHMAAQPLVRRSVRAPVETFATNVMGTVNLLEALRTVDGVKAVLVVTTDKVYENNERGSAFRESDALGGHDPYAASKASAELVASSYARTYFRDRGVFVGTARGGNVIGGGDFSEDRIVPDIWRAARARIPIRLRYPQATRPWQHVLDCLSGYLAYLQALAEGRTEVAALNFGPEPAAPVTVVDIVAAMQSALESREGYVTDEGPQPREMLALALELHAGADDARLARPAAGRGRRGRHGRLVSGFRERCGHASVHAPADRGVHGIMIATQGSPTPHCRLCEAPLTQVFADLGATPLANRNLKPGEEAGERRYPLIARVCSQCLLVQVDNSVPPEQIFSDYDYFSSVSTHWVAHAGRYAEAMTERFALGPRSLVVEVASNDGYLLQHFKARGIPILGIEPAANVAAAAVAKGIATEVMFFGVDSARSLAQLGIGADLMAANNVLAHVPDVRDFVGGFAVLLKPSGVATFEFPHLLNLIDGVQFDTIYHEHFFYISLVASERMFATADLRVFDVEELPTHGGSLRLFVCHARAAHRETQRLKDLRERERARGLHDVSGYQDLARRIEAVRASFLAFMDEARRAGKVVAAYGAAAKGNTFLNVCGTRYPEICAIYDANPTKQGKLAPGSHIPILPPEKIAEQNPDFIVILPWNIADEVVEVLRAIPQWTGRPVVAVPEVRVL